MTRYSCRLSYTSGRRCLVFVFAICSVNSFWSQLPAASFHQLKRDEQLLSSFYHCLAEDEYGFIWFGSRHGGGLYRYDGYDLKSFVVDPSKLHISLSSNEINTVHSYRDGKLYIGTHGGMTILDLVSGEMRSFADDINKVPDYSTFLIQPIIPDKKWGCTWLGTAHGLCVLKWKTDSIECLLPEEQDDRIPIPGGVNDMIEDLADKHILWLGTGNGVFSYDKESGQYRYHNISLTENMHILDLYQDQEGAIWIGGDSGVEKHEAKLIRYLPQTESSVEYKLAVLDGGAIQNAGEVFNLMPSANKDQLWVSTKTCVGLLHTQTGKYDAWTYDADRPDGLLPNEFFRAMLADRHGRLWVSSWQGVQYAKSAFAGAGNPLFLPDVAITDVQASNERADRVKPLIYQGSLQLKEDQRDITIRFVLPNPLYADQVTYQYQLIGWDKEWITSEQRQVHYTRLRGGDYSFVVRGKEGQADWGKTTRLQVVIDKKLMEFAWFRILSVMLVAGIIIGTYRYLISRTRKEERLKAAFNKKVSEIEMQALRAQMNPHFLFNSLNSIRYFALTKDKDATADYLTKFSLLVRTILNHSKSHTISLKEEMAALRLYIEIEHLRLEGKFEYHMDVDSSIHIEEAQMPPMILQPFVENAIWHGLMARPKGGKLLVQVRDMGTQIQCIIEDNGIGRAKAKEMMNNHSAHKKSMGMQITGDRISLINRMYGIDTQVQIIDLMNANGEAAGTRVVVNIPLIHEEVS